MVQDLFCQTLLPLQALELSWSLLVWEAETAFPEMRVPDRKARDIISNASCWLTGQDEPGEQEGQH